MAYKRIKGITYNTRKSELVHVVEHGEAYNRLIYRREELRMTRGGHYFLYVSAGPLDDVFHVCEGNTLRGAEWIIPLTSELVSSWLAYVSGDAGYTPDSPAWLWTNFAESMGRYDQWEHPGTGMRAVMREAYS